MRLRELFRSSKPHSILVKWVLLSTIIGFLTGIFVSLLEIAVMETLNDIFGLVLGNPWLLPLIPTVGLTLTGLIRDRFVENSYLHGTEEVLDAYHYRDGDLSLRDVPGKIIASILTIGMEGSAGLEGPSIHIGGSVGAALRKLLAKIGIEEDGRILLLTGAASGIGAIFKAPLTGLMFSLEVPYKDDMAHQAVVPALISSVVSYITLVSILGAEPLFRHFRPFKGLDLYVIALSLIEGLLIGIAAIIFVKLMDYVEGICRGKRYVYRGLAGGASLGALGLITLMIYGGLYPLGLSYDLVRASFSVKDPYFFLLMAILKMIATALTLGSAGIGGVFIPSIVIGASLGSALSALDPDAMSLFVAIGMSSFLSAAFKTPLASVTFVAETTGSESYIIPGLIASAVSYLITGNYSLPKNQKYVESARIEELERVKVKELMGPPPPVLSSEMTIKRFFSEHFLKDHTFSVFPIAGKDGRLIGVVTINDVDSVPPVEWDKTKLIDLVRKVEFLDPEENLMDALDKMYDYDMCCLPVIDHKTGEIVGTLSADAVIRLLEHKRKLKKYPIFLRR